MAGNPGRHVRPGMLILGLTLLVVGVAVSGCVRVHAALTVSADDRVSGDLIAAEVSTGQTDRGPQLVVPTDLVGRTSTRTYRANGYVGSELSFQNLSFADVSRLATAASTENSRYLITFQRIGDLVDMSGSIDLRQVPPVMSDVRVTIDFPGRLLHADGTVNNHVVIWTPAAGQNITMTATVQSRGGHIHSLTYWALVLFSGCVLTALFVMALALLARHRHLRKEGARAARS